MELGIRRNDYIASIRFDIDELNRQLQEFPSLIAEGEDLVKYCKLNKLRHFKRVAKLEVKLLKKKQNYTKKHLKDLQKLLYKAEQYAPGRQEG